MRVHPVVVAELVAGETTVYGDEGHHLARVLRVRAGDEVRAFDGRGREAHGVVRRVERDRVTLELAPPVTSEAEPPVDLTVAVALLKANKLADVVRMCTELGVRRFVLLGTARSEPEDVSPAKLQRLERVAREAAKQSGRAVIPDITGPVGLEDLELAANALVADPEAHARVAEHVLRISRAGDGSHATSREGLPRAETQADEPRVAPHGWMTITGPEGGWEASEVRALVARGAAAVSLGRSILRAETAPVALAAALLLSLA